MGNVYQINNEKVEKSFNSDKHLYQKYKKEKVDLVYVITHLFDENYVVEVNGHLYDLSFAIDEDGISYEWSSAPSPHLKSWEIIEESFRYGEWYRIID